MQGSTTRRSFASLGFSFFAAVMLAVEVGCGGGGGGGTTGSGTGAGTAGGTSGGFIQDLMLPSLGGVVKNASGTLVLTLPPNAVATNTRVSLTKPSGLPALTSAVSGTVFAFTPVTLKAPVALAFHIPTNVTQSDLRAYSFSGVSWDPLPSTFDSNSLTVSTLSSKLGTFAVFAPSTFTNSATVTAEAMMYPAPGGQPAVRVTWDPSSFASGNGVRVAYQIYRNDVSTNPVEVSDGPATNLAELGITHQVTYTSLSSDNLASCSNLVLDNAGGVSPGLTAGQPYFYSVELIYSFASTVIPGTTGSTATATGTIGTTTTGTETATGTGTGTATATAAVTGGTGGSSTGIAGTTGTTGATTGGSPTGCYFVTTRAPGMGQATPLSAAVITTANNSKITDNGSFVWQSVRNPSFPATIEYIVEASTSASFRSPVQLAHILSDNQGPLSTPLSGIASAFPSGSSFFVRVGARNAADSPGPVPDPVTGERYLFGNFQTLISG